MIKTKKGEQLVRPLFFRPSSSSSYSYSNLKDKKPEDEEEPFDLAQGPEPVEGDENKYDCNEFYSIFAISIASISSAGVNPNICE